jgi:predicted peptidase
MLALLLSFVAPAQTGFVDKAFQNPDGHESPYVVFVPHGHDGSKPVPVVLFLHGAGETLAPKREGLPVPQGKLPAEVGIGPHIKGRREKTFPAVVVIPRAEGFGWQAESDNGKRAMAMLDATIKEYNGDPSRVYLTGLSMGGFGTWSLAAAYPDRWAAIAPICGGLRWRGQQNPPTPADVAAKIKHIPCWCWHGGADAVVKPELSREVIAALKAAGGKPRYTELEDVGHNSWDAAYATDDLYAWLFKQKKQ